MEPPLLLTYDDNSTSKNDDVFISSKQPPSFTDPGESLCLVPFRWLKETECFGRGVLYRVGLGDVVVGEDFMSVDGFEETVSSDISVCLRRTEEEEEEEVVVVEAETLALVSEWMFFTAIKWHYAKNGGNMAEGKNALDLFSLRIRVFNGEETNTLVVKICGKDNDVEDFECASKIFCSKSGTLQIWDFSGQTNQLFLDDMKQFKDQSNEIVIGLQIYGLSCPVKEEERGKEDMVVEQQSMADDPTSSSSTTGIGYTDQVNWLSPNDSGCSQTSIVDGPTPSSSTMAIGCIEKENLPSASDNSYSWTFSLGLTGLNNLGNTCFMNSAIQCLVHTPKLADYFLGNFRRDLNFENPLGMNGKLAIVFGDLLRSLWVSKAAAIRPNLFKSTISSFTTQFGGYCQHDSQEFLAFLLNGLHEDLNCVKHKPYVQAKDEDGRPHEEVADEYWEYHLSRNDSIIIDICQGQERSTLTCPDCRKSSVKFDPLMYLTLQIPSTTLRKITLTVLSHGAATLDKITVTVPKNGTFENLQEVVAEACSLRDDETLRIAEICNREIFYFLDNPCDLVEKIRDSDRLVAYKLPKDISGSQLVAFIHEYVEDFPPNGFPRYHYRHPRYMHSMRYQGRNHQCQCSPNKCPEEDGGPATDLVMHHQDRSHGSHCPLYKSPDDNGGSITDDNGGSMTDAVMLYQGRNRRLCGLAENDIRHQKRNCRPRNPYYGYPEYDMDMCMHSQMMMRHQMYPYVMRPPRKFGIPLLTKMSDFSEGSKIREAFLELINPFLLPDEKSSHDNIDATVDIMVPDEEDAEMENKSEKDLDDTDDDFEFALESRNWRKCEIEMDKPVPITIEGDVPIKVVVNWPKKVIGECDNLLVSQLLNKLPVVFKSAFMEDSVSLYKCMEAYLKEEPLGPDDMWYCPNCKEHKQASKKLDLWRLPEILVIHLKRFSYNTSFQSTKLETHVDFPIDNFDISDYVTHKNEKVSRCYALYAVTNHYGGSSGGHYTAFVKNDNTWYEFDDSRVAPVPEERIKTPAAYVLFYKRV